jgi:protein SCO1/2
MTFFRLLVALVAVIIFSPQSGFAGYGTTPETTLDTSILKIDEETYLGARIKQDTVLIDEDGNEFTMGEMLGVPIILLLSYYNCDGYCPTVNTNLLDTLKKTKFQAGKDYQVITVSFDKNDTIETAKKFSVGLDMDDEMRKGWRVAILKNKEEIESFAGSLGYKFFWSYRDQIFLHPGVYIFASPKARVVRYLYASNVSEKDMELAIVDAYGNKISKSKTIDLLISVCYSYNYEEGKYTVNYPIFISIASLLFGIFSVVLSLFIYRKRRCS